MKNGSGDGFTLTELMIVVAVVGIIAMIGMPKFADLVRKSKEAKVKGSLGAVRSALSIYYSDTEGLFPAGPAGENVNFPIDALTANQKYLISWPDIEITPYHGKTTTINAFDSSDLSAAQDNGQWAYVGKPAAQDWGHVAIQCLEQDSVGTVWSSR